MFFIRYATQAEAIRAMYHLRHDYDLRFGKRKKSNLDEQTKEEKCSDDEPRGGENFNIMLDCRCSFAAFHTQDSRVQLLKVITS